MKATIVIQPNGKVEMSKETWNALVKKSGLRTRKKRIVNKIIKRLLSKLVEEYAQKATKA